MSRENKIKIAELFCGAGGFVEGAKKAGFEHIWGIDIDKDPVKRLKIIKNVKLFMKK